MKIVYRYNAFQFQRGTPLLVECTKQEFSLFSHRDVDVDSEAWFASNGNLIVSLTARPKRGILPE